MLRGFARGLRELRGDARKYLLAFLAMVTGAAVLTVTVISVTVASDRLSTGVDSLGGVADAGLVPSEPGGLIDSDEVAEIAHLPSVTRSIPTYSESTVLRSPSGREAQPMLTGYPTRHNADLFFDELDGRLPASGADELLLPGDIAQQLGVDVRDTVQVLGRNRTVDVIVTGIIDPDELGMLAYDNVFTDLGTAQSIFDRQGLSTRVDVQVTGEPSQWALEVRQQLPGGVMVQETGAVTASFAPVLIAVSSVLQIISVAALALTVLLAATAFSSVIRTRRPSYALLRVMGAPRRWIARGLIMEAAILGLVGGLLGALIGPVVSLGLIQVLPGTGGLPSASGIVVDVVVGIGACLAASLMGCLLSLRALYRRESLEGLLSTNRGLSTRHRLMMATTGGASIMAAVALTWRSSSAPFHMIAFFLLLMGAALTAPPLISAVARLLKNRRWTLAYASRRLYRDGQMTAPAVIIAFVVCLATALLTVAHAIEGAMEQQVSNQFGADLHVSSRVAVDAEDPGGMRSVPGVERATAMGAFEVRVRPDRSDDESLSVSALSIDPAGFFDAASLAFQSGGGESRMAESGAVALPESVAARLGVDVGDHLIIQSGERMVQAPVAGVFVSMATGTQIVVPRDLAEEIAQPGYDTWYLAVSDGSSPAAVRDGVEAAVRTELPGASVITGTEMRDRAIGELVSYTASVFGLVCVLAVVGSIGSAGIISLSVMRRSAELGTLRAIGLSAAATGRLLVSEVALVGVPAVVTGVLVGSGAGWVLSRVLSDAMGISAVFRMDPAFAFVVVAITLGAVMIAGYWPVIRARRIAPSFFLKYS